MDSHWHHTEPKAGKRKLKSWKWAFKKQPERHWGYLYTPPHLKICSDLTFRGGTRQIPHDMILLQISTFCNMLSIPIKYDLSPYFKFKLCPQLNLVRICFIQWHNVISLQFWGGLFWMANKIVTKSAINVVVRWNLASIGKQFGNYMQSVCDSKANNCEKSSKIQHFWCLHRQKFTCNDYFSTQQPSSCIGT